jgi:glyoxylase-like metal-dependent hydrolase (beta-lactamase superfamily II)
MKWLIGLLVVIAALGGFAWWAVLDGAAPAQAENEIDLAAYRALVANDAPETLPTDVRIEFVGSSGAPSFAAEAGDFSGEKTFSYNAFQIVAPDGDTIVDGAVDQETLNLMSENAGEFSAPTYQRVLDAMERASRVMITHEHLDHVMAIARHPDPEALAPRLQLTRAQLDGLPEHAPGGVLAPAIANIAPIDLSTPQRIAPGIVAVAAPGHSPGTILIYVRGATREYLLIGDIAWVMGSVEDARGRPRFIRWIMPGVDPDRAAVLRQLRALHDIAAAEPDLVIVPAHDDAYLRGLLAGGALTEHFVVAAAETPATSGESPPASP